MKLSIVTPSFRQARTLGQTIESALSQEGDFEIEYFVMDGGSSDGSVDVIRDFERRLQAGAYAGRCRGVDFQWVSESDRGQTDAINKGLRRASGDICAYLNSDDAYLPATFQKITELFAANPRAQFIYGDGDVIDESGEVQWEWRSRAYDYDVITSYDTLGDAFTNYIMQPAVFWRAEVHRKIGLFDETFHYSMDLEYWTRAGHAGLRLLHVPEKLAQFRIAPGTKSLSSPTVFWPENLEIFRRYRPGGLPRALAFYYYNVARLRDFDLDAAFAEADGAVERWDALPPKDVRRLRSQMAAGAALACCLCGSALLRAGREARAMEALRRGLSRKPALILHPSALVVLLKRAAGRRFASALDSLVSRLVLLCHKNPEPQKGQ